LGPLIFLAAWLAYAPLFKRNSQQKAAGAERLPADDPAAHELRD
jgi:hypothetical protein